MGIQGKTLAFALEDIFSATSLGIATIFWRARLLKF